MRSSKSGIYILSRSKQAIFVRPPCVVFRAHGPFPRVLIPLVKGTAPRGARDAMALLVILFSAVQSCEGVAVRALANREYLGDLFVRIAYDGRRSLLI